MTFGNSTRAKAVALCTLVLAGAGCGGAEPADPQTRSAVSDAVRTYFDGLARRDGGRVCGVLSEDERARIDDDGVPCAEAVVRTADALPQELRDELRRTEITAVERDGDAATAELRIDSAYASRPRTREAKLVREDGAWRLEDLPSEDADPDPVTTCFVAGVQAFEDGSADPLWQREGRADFAEYLRRTCRIAVRRDVVRENAAELSTAQRERFQAIAAGVLREMIAEGRVRAP